MQHEVCRRNGEQNAGHATDDEGDHETDRPVHRQFVADTPAIHGEEPVEHLRPGRDRDDHRGNPEEGVDGRSRTHREEMVQPDEIGKDHDHAGCVDHRSIAEQPLAAEGCNHFGKDAKGRQDEDVDFRVAPDPDQVDIHHRVAAEIVGEEVGAGVAVKSEKRQRCGQNRESGNDQDIGAKRGPGEDRHLHECHAWRAHLDDGGDQVDARQCRADAGDLKPPDVIIDADAGTVIRQGRREAGRPAIRYGRTRRRTTTP